MNVAILNLADVLSSFDNLHSSYPEISSITFIDSYPASIEAEQNIARNLSRTRRVLWGTLEMPSANCIHSISLIKKIFPYHDQTFINNFYQTYNTKSQIQCPDISELLFMAQRTLRGTMPTIDLVCFIHDLFNFWIVLIDQMNIDCFFALGPPHSLIDYILVKACIYRNIKTISCYPSGMESSCFMLDMTTSKYLKNPSLSISKNLIEDLNSFITNSTSLQCGMDVYSENVNKEIKKFISSSREFFLSGSEHSQYVLEEKVKLATKYDQLSKIKPYPSEKNKHYLFLHYQPEASSSPMGRDFAEQRYAIRYILSKIDFEKDALIIKEHPSQFSLYGNTNVNQLNINELSKNILSYREPSFYEYCVQFDNCYLSPRFESADQILQRKEATIWSLNGTILLQAYANGCNFEILKTYSPYNHLKQFEHIEVENRLEFLKKHYKEFLWPLPKRAQKVLMNPSDILQMINLVLSSS